VEGYRPETYGDRFADVYDQWYPDVTDAEACADRVAALVADAGGGPVLELGVGSGRLAVPIAARGMEVHGIDASAAMLARLAERPGGDQVRAVHGDMAELALGDLQPSGGYAVVLVAFNTLFNLATEDRQRRCLAAVAAALAPEGSLLVEAFVPDADAGEGHGALGAVEPRHIGLDEVVLTVSRTDPGTQTVIGQHVQLTEAGVRLRPWHLRYATPEQLDAMAADAGLVLAWRDAGWAGERFDAASAGHVTCYRRR
jgi:SAM-dependent methyltransferase